MCLALCTVHTRFEYIKKESLDLIFLWYAFRLWRNISTYVSLEGSAVLKLEITLAYNKIARYCRFLFRLDLLKVRSNFIFHFNTRNI